jgi:hypothetical protein
MRRREFGLGSAAMWPSMARAKALGLTIPETLLATPHDGPAGGNLRPGAVDDDV